LGVAPDLLARDAEATMFPRARLIIRSCMAALAGACATRGARVGSAEVTSVEMTSSYKESERAARDLTAGQYEEALGRAEHALTTSPDNPWATYDRAVALRHLGRIDASVRGFREAELRFGDGDAWGKSISIYGRARALDDAGRCAEAAAAYRDYATYIRNRDARGAESALTYAIQCRRPDQPIGDEALSEMVDAEMSDHYATALTFVDRVGQPARDSGWLDYNRGVALAGLARTDEAVLAYRSAEGRFGRGDPHGRAISIYGRARALDLAGRCVDAKTAYQEFAQLVRDTEPRDADRALEFAARCSERVGSTRRVK
jgi:tetratricopeptide (TPR) repeat protein